MTGHHQNGDYLEILLAGKIIKMDDATANNWQFLSRKRLLTQGEATARIGLAELRGKQMQVFGDFYSLDPAVGAELAVNVLDMAVNCIRGNNQLIPNLPA